MKFRTQIPLLILVCAAACSWAASAQAPPLRYEAYAGRVLEFDMVQTMGAHEGQFQFLPKPDGTGPQVSADSLTSVLDQEAKLISPVPKNIVSAGDRMPLPQVLMGPGIGIEAGLDSGFLIPRLAASSAEALAMLRYVLAWNLLIRAYPQIAFARMVARATKPEVAAIDVLHLTGMLTRHPGYKLKRAPSKQLWQELYQSSNPVYRLIALETFDSVEQSPAELLALYQTCLFDGCSYLELRALEAIVRNKDFRQEVAELLDRYLMTGPPVNDGTLPVMEWQQFPSLVEGAKSVIVQIRGS